ncbi:MAG: amidohydrolase family protein, partial [Gammaproteobacteria bacterium]
VPAIDALRMGTINGARALGMEAELGSLKKGKAADITAIDLSGIGAAPLYDPISQIVYAGHRDQVTNVWVGGRRVLADGELINIDETALIHSAQQWRAKISRTP